jgi:hypothetical protein
MSIFNTLTNVVKAGVAVAVSPIALAADIVTLPGSACDPNAGPFDRTGKMLNAAGRCITEAIKPDSIDS